jgi:hypothetical protein
MLTSSRELAQQRNAGAARSGEPTQQNDNASGPRDKTLVHMRYEDADADNTADCCNYLDHHDDPLRYAGRNGLQGRTVKAKSTRRKRLALRLITSGNANTGMAADCLAALPIPTP